MSTDSPITASAVFLNRPPIGWFLLDVFRKKSRSWEWVGFFTDIAPDDRKTRMRELRRWSASHRWDHERFVTVPGKHRSYASAREAIENAMITRH